MVDADLGDLLDEQLVRQLAERASWWSGPGPTISKRRRPDLSDDHNDRLGIPLAAYLVLHIQHCRNFGIFDSEDCLTSGHFLSPPAPFGAHIFESTLIYCACLALDGILVCGSPNCRP